MGIFSSSWKYHAYAASTSLFEEDNHPHTFQTVMLEGLRMDDSFANILRFSYNTDMYARTRSMVRYATREVDPYIRGLPTSNFTTFTVEKDWIDAAILREIKMPLEDFYWMKHGDFDPDFLTNMFIHDHYMDINYFPWPDGCLLPLANPNFDDGEDGWIPTDAVVNDRIGEITTTTGTLYNESVGEVSPGEIISLRATCDRGSNVLDDGQLGSLNLTFYDTEGTEISTESDTNTTGLNGAWELLSIIATAPDGTVTAKAWAGAKIIVADMLALCRDLHAWWSFDETSGDRYNSHGSLYTFHPYQYDYYADPRITPNGTVSSTTGKIDNAVQCVNHVDTLGTPMDYLQTDFDPGDPLATGGAFSICGWVKFDRLDRNVSIVMKGEIDKSIAFANKTDWSVGFRTSDQAIYFGGDAAFAFVTGSWSTGVWYFISAWFEPDVEAGISVNDGTPYLDLNPGSSISQDNNKIVIGNYVTAGWWYSAAPYGLDGAVDEWGFWNRKLTDTNISWLYNEGAGRTYEEIMANCPRAPFCYVYDSDQGGSWSVCAVTFGTFNISYNYGSQPSYKWLVYTPFTETELTGSGQLLFKVDIAETISGFQEDIEIDGDLDKLGEWLDIWWWEGVEVWDGIRNGIPESYLLNISIAEDDGAGNPVTNTIQVIPIQMTAYRGYRDYIILDTFSVNGNLEGHEPDINRTRPYEEGPWIDLYWTVEENYEAGWFSKSNGLVRYYGWDGTPEGICALDIKVTDFSFAIDVDFHETNARILGRLQDIHNYWQLEILDPSTANPVMNLAKVVNNVETIVGTLALTELPPLIVFNNETFTMRLEFDGDNITGAFDMTQEGGVVMAPLEIHVTDSTFNTKTNIGLRGKGGAGSAEEAIRYRQMSILPLPIEFDAVTPYGDSTTPQVFSVSDPGLFASIELYFYEGTNTKTEPPWHSSISVWDSKSDDVYWGDGIHERAGAPVYWDAFVVKWEPVSGDTDQLRWFYTAQSDPEDGWRSQPGVWREFCRYSLSLWADPGESFSATFDVTVAVGNGEGNDYPGTYPNYDDPIPYGPAPNVTHHTRRFTFNVSG